MNEHNITFQQNNSIYKKNDKPYIGHLKSNIPSNHQQHIKLLYGLHYFLYSLYFLLLPY